MAVNDRLLIKNTYGSLLEIWECVERGAPYERHNGKKGHYFYFKVYHVR